MQSYLQKLEERLSSGQERAQARVPVPQNPSAQAGAPAVHNLKTSASQAGAPPPQPAQKRRGPPSQIAQNRRNPGALGPGTPALAVHSQIFVMQSSGGITALNTAAGQPVRTVLSGPAGGIVGAAA